MPQISGHDTFVMECQHAFIFPASFLPWRRLCGCRRRSLWCSDSSVPLVCWWQHGLGYLKCFVLFCFDESILFIFPCPLSTSWIWYTFQVYVTFLFFRLCLGNVWWHASSLKATSAMILTCRLHCSCRAGSSSKTRSSKHTRLQWTYSSRRWSSLSM